MLYRITTLGLYGGAHITRWPREIADRINRAFVRLGIVSFRANHLLTATVRDWALNARRPEDAVTWSAHTATGYSLSRRKRRLEVVAAPPGVDGDRTGGL